MAGGHCVLGGTFTYVHSGHLRLFDACREFSRMTVGLTSDAYVRKHKIHPSFPYGERLSGLKNSLSRNGLLSRAAIVRIESESDVADRIGADAIVVSEETAEGANRINSVRKRLGLAPLRIICVPLAHGEDLKKISCISIYLGKTDLAGKLRAPLLFQAGTDNPTKLSGTRLALARIFGRKFALSGHKEDSRVSHHPFNSETFVGAKNRAHAAWKRANGIAAGAALRGKAGLRAKTARAGAIVQPSSRASRGCDYSLGMESGLFTLAKGMHIDITICCVYDGARETYGTGMGFVVPEWIAKKIRAHGSDLSKVMAETAGVKDIGRKQGALGWFSDGKMHRRQQIEAAVECAFVPRIAEAKRGMHY